jgi:hypothetical protein
MGSINPVFLLPGARQQNAEAIASGLQASVTLGVGQFCTNPGLVFVEQGLAAQAFLQELERAMAATPPGTMLIADLRAAYRSGAEKFAKTPGVRRAVSVNAAADAGNAKVGAALFVTDAATFLKNHSLMDEVFGPSTLIVECASRDQMFAAARQLEGQLTATIHALPNELVASRELVELLAVKAGRLLFNGFPTGVEVCHAMTHGGPYPATADGRSTSVGTRAIARFARPVCYQNFPDGGNDGANPESGLVLSGNMLYGTTKAYGAGYNGTVFAINTDGTDFTTLCDFVPNFSDGDLPSSSLVLSGNTLYGTTLEGGGGPGAGWGTVFALSLGSIPLNIQNSGQYRILTWGNPAFSLQSASELTGQWTTLSDAASPYTVSATNAQSFFRLVYTNSP